MENAPFIAGHGPILGAFLIHKKILLDDIRDLMV
jgi:hypothetical protein